MRVFPQDGDSPEEISLMSQIDETWKETVKLRKMHAESEKKEALLRAKLRMIREGISEGEILVLALKNQPGKLEVSSDYPYLWIRILDASGNPTKRRLKLEEGTSVKRPDGSIPKAKD